MTLLKKLLKKLTKNNQRAISINTQLENDSQVNAPQLNSSDHSSNQQPITALIDRLQYCAPLLALQGRRQLIEILIRETQNPGFQSSGSQSNTQHFQSLIVGINTETNQLLLDELFPACPQLRPGHTVIFRHVHGNQVLEFEIQLQARHLNPADDNHHLVFTLPKHFQYQPRRHQPRLYIDKSQPLTVRLQSPLYEPWFATAQNISASGMRLSIGGNITDQLQPGDLLRQCDFQFSLTFQVRCQARIIGFRFCRSPYRHTQVSIEFIRLSPRQQLQLQQIIETLTGQNIAA